MYKNIIRIAFLFATGICMTACSSGDDNIADNTIPVAPGTKENVVTLTGTINIGSSDITRAVDKDGNVSWTEGDQVYVAYEQVGTATSYTAGTITDVTGKTAKFTAKLENPKNGGHIGLAYPYSKLDATNPYSISNSNFKFKFNYDDSEFLTQSGTPEYISEKGLDYASSEADVTMNISGSSATLSDNITLLNQVCICEFSLKVRTITTPETYSPISATKLEIMLDGSSTPTYTITPAYSTDVFYVVMQPRNGAVSLKATYKSASTATPSELDPTHVESDDVGKIIVVKPDADNQAYLVDKSNVTFTTSTLTKAYGTSTKLNKGKFYKQDVKYTTNQYLPIAVMAHVGEISGYCTKFTALALEDATGVPCSVTAGTTDIKSWVESHEVKIAGTKYNYSTMNTLGSTGYDIVEESGPDPSDNTQILYVDNQTSKKTGTAIQGWRVPSLTDWRYIFDDLCGSVDAHAPIGIVENVIYGANDLGSTIDSKCGNTQIYDHYNKAQYWTSSTKDDGGTYKVWRYDFSNNRTSSTPGHFMWVSSTDNSNVRMLISY